jgi:hypothetical protein
MRNKDPNLSQTLNSMICTSTVSQDSPGERDAVRHSQSSGRVFIYRQQAKELLACHGLHYTRSKRNPCPIASSQRPNISPGPRAYAYNDRFHHISHLRHCIPKPSRRPHAPQQNANSPWGQQNCTCIAVAYWYRTNSCCSTPNASSQLCLFRTQSIWEACTTPILFATFPQRGIE